MVSIIESILPSAKDILQIIYKDDPTSISLINRAQLFVLEIFSEKLNTYALELSNMGNFDPLEFLSEIKPIISDVYETFSLIKFSLSKSNKEFISNHIDLILIAVILFSMTKIPDPIMINNDNLIKTLNFVKHMSGMKLDLKINKCFLFCFGPTS